MRQIPRIFSILFSSTLCLGLAHAGIPNNSDPTTFLGPTAKLSFTNTINNTTAYSLAGEAGIKNFRVGGTVGWALPGAQWMKVSAEYLWQDITYAFFSGNSDQWVQQGALGATYEYDFINYAYQPALDINAYASHSPNKNLSTVSGVFVDSQGMLQSFVDNRRIAGSNAAALSPGLTMTPWQGARFGADLNYDVVSYDTNSSPSQDARGLGGTVHFNQAFANNLGIGLLAAVRQPFNNYAANVYWSNVHYYGNWTLGLFGDYTDGKNTLPNTWNLGVSADYYLDTKCPVAVPTFNLKGEANLKGETVLQPISDNLLAWTAVPAVYMPQVLAITDENISKGCTPGVLAFTTPYANSNTLISGAPVTFPIFATGHFTGSGITYSLVSSEVNLPPPGNRLSINPETGTITVNFNGDFAGTFTVRVIATLPCGSVQSNTFTISTLPAR